MKIMNKKIIGVLLCILISGVGIIPSIAGYNPKLDNTNFFEQKTIDAPIPDLECIGEIHWENIWPISYKMFNQGYGSFFVENVGEPGSILKWGIDSSPSWAAGWAYGFPGDYYNNLTPADGPVRMDVIVTAPKKFNKNFSGDIIVVNLEDSSDIDSVPVTLSTKIKIYRILGHDVEFYTRERIYYYTSFEDDKRYWIDLDDFLIHITFFNRIWGYSAREPNPVEFI
jgi:hypothetical protein